MCRRIKISSPRPSSPRHTDPAPARAGPSADRLNKTGRRPDGRTLEVRTGCSPPRFPDGNSLPTRRRQEQARLGLKPLLRRAPKKHTHTPRSAKNLVGSGLVSGLEADSTDAKGKRRRGGRGDPERPPPPRVSFPRGDGPSRRNAPRPGEGAPRARAHPPSPESTASAASPDSEPQLRFPAQTLLRGGVGLFHCSARDFSSRPPFPSPSPPRPEAREE